MAILTFLLELENLLANQDTLAKQMVGVSPKIEKTLFSRKRGNWRWWNASWQGKEEKNKWDMPQEKVID